MKIVADSNIWINSNFLRNPDGLSLTAYCARHGLKIVVHEVIEREVEFNFIDRATQSIEKIRTRYNYLLSNLGKAKELVLPEKTELIDALKSRFTQLEGIIERLPFSFAHAQKALDMVISHLPPNSNNNQQFKDSIIWASCLELADRGKTAFVTEDKGFFKERDPRKGLADTIKVDVENKGGRLEIYYGLTDFLARYFSADTIISSQELAQGIYAFEEQRIRKYVEEFVMTLGDLRLEVLGKFLTEHDRVLSIKYRGAFEIIDHISTAKDPSYEIQGTCLYDIKRKSILQNYINLFSFSWIDADGTRKDKKDQFIYGVGNIVEGHRIVEYHIRHEI